MHNVSRLFTLTVILTLTLGAFAQEPNPEDFEPILVPVYFFGAGAQGSQWETSIELLATEETAFFMPVAILEGSDLCPRVCGCALESMVNPLSPARVCGALGSGPSGIYLYVPKDVPRGTVHISARVRDTTRQAEGAGVEIPLVRPSDLRDGPILLLDLPTTPRFRTSLRVYNVNKYTGENVHLTIYDARALEAGDRIPLVETVIQMPDPPLTFRFDPFPLEPSSFAMIGDLVAAFPQLRDVEAVALEVQGDQTIADPPPPSRRYWAYSTITNNVTQEVTVVSPQ